MGKLYVIGNVYSDNKASAEELFSVLTTAGYTLAYNTMSATSAVIMKEIEDEPEESEE